MQKRPFVIMPLALLEDTRLIATDKLVYSLLRAYSNPEENIFPAYSILETKAGVKKLTVLRSVSALEKYGYLKVIRGVGSINRYVFLDVEPVSSVIPVSKDIPVSSVIPQPVSPVIPYIDLNRFKKRKKEKKVKVDGRQVDLEEFIASSTDDKLVSDATNRGENGLAGVKGAVKPTVINKEDLSNFEYLQGIYSTIGVWVDFVKAGSSYYIRKNCQLADKYVSGDEIKKILSSLSEQRITAREIPHTKTYAGEILINNRKEVA